MESELQSHHQLSHGCCAVLMRRSSDQLIRSDVVVPGNPGSDVVQGG